VKAFRSAVLAVIALAGCGGTTASPQVNFAALRRFSAAATAWMPPPHPDHGLSWISPEVKAQQTQLLFVSDAGTNDVYLYKLPTLKIVGTITGFTQPQGECSDSKGDVWVTDTAAQTIYEVSHQGRLKHTLRDSYGYPDGCAWDPKSGDLAVMNLFGISGSSGAVLVYPKAVRSPSLYANAQQYYYNFGGYDGSGNLFFDGRSQSGALVLSELPAGAKSVNTLKITAGKIYFPGLVQWNATNHELLVGDQQCGNVNAACVYRLTITGSDAKITGSTKLKNSSGGQVCDLVQGVESNGQILGSDFEFCGYSASSTDLWAYPGGGPPKAHNSNADRTPVGTALSIGS
jgi:hypothetical protein